MEVIKNKLFGGGQLTKEEAMELIEAPLDELCAAANDVREHFCGNVFDVCTIINGKSGKCSENCKFCSQSPLLSNESGCLITDWIGNDRRADKYNEKARRTALFIVTSGRALSSEIGQGLRKLGSRQRNQTSHSGSFGLWRKRNSPN